eukprot:Protomagalhaensia_wolfi_Nauph_80__3870@NODE_391_length_2619_cov_64_251550_g295_i0_p2_GENE_NODE_391_length_2619_cov_64_251550_g295_i0NODE_391_length_2619_cov_64_251550_g295_i0_p2_ORF_typecomplete_len366_score36_38TPT/PF03151_16/1_2e57UAA/PF08449_11/3_1e21SLC35F/PF06027_12/2e03SLC35F/PF06027_12/3_2e08EamA/PF00892_20/1_6e05EamA/PF00892_20/0_076Nuc_sug_transp/PF04142_15/3_4e05Nuc_sug_transp/PF04142_15/0_22PUNUT/PF16913_5/6_8e06CRTlike/PF08627_10/0_00025CRTlike/PF08627_10/1_3e03_NODE_391_length_2619_
MLAAQVAAPPETTIEIDSADKSDSGSPLSAAATRTFYRLWFYRVQHITHLCRECWTGQEAVANAYLIAWFIINIVITLSSKAMFSNFKFPYPMMLTAAHCAVTGLGSQIAASFNCYEYTPVNLQMVRDLIFFSLVFTINIWLSNYGLLVVSVSVHQVFRTTIPLFTMVLSLIIYQESYPWRMVPSVLLVILGVAATVFGDVETTLYGAFVVAAGCAFSSLKGIMTQKAQIGKKGLHTFDLLRVVCPLAVLELMVLGIVNGEVAALIVDAPDLSLWTIPNLCLQGLLAFVLNFVSFKCVALKNPLTMNIAGNIKQIVTPLLGIMVVGGSITATLILGLVVTFVGAIWYGGEARRHKKQKEAKAIEP